MEYEIWQKEKEDTQKKLDCLSNEDYTQELIQVYSRKLEIIDGILVDLSPQLDDEQYEGTTYYKYEDELKLLEKNEEKLEPLVAGITEENRIRREHQELLEDLGMTQTQFEDFQAKQNQEKQKKRIN